MKTELLNYDDNVFMDLFMQLPISGAVANMERNGTKRLCLRKNKMFLMILLLLQSS